MNINIYEYKKNCLNTEYLTYACALFVNYTFFFNYLF